MISYIEDNGKLEKSNIFFEKRKEGCTLTYFDTNTVDRIYSNILTRILTCG